MLNIKCFTLDTANALLLVSLASDDGKYVQEWSFSFEFLRVVSLTPATKGAVAAHKKQVKLTHIESVAKHGFRFYFDDGFTIIYNLDQLTMLHNQHESLWQNYLDALKKSGHSREATFDIKQL